MCKSAIVVILAFLGSGLCAQADLQPGPFPDPYPTMRSLPFPPPGTQPLDYRIIAVQEARSGASLPFVLEEEPSQPPTIAAVQDGLQLRSEAEYRTVFGTASVGIDWNVSRIYVFQELNVYKFGGLDSSVGLAGLCRSDSAIYIGRRFSQYGPVQGIAQLPEWFSYRYRSLFILLPKDPDPIYVIDLGLEDIPRDIP